MAGPLQDQVADAADQHLAEAEAWRVALEAEQGRLAVLCRPKHAAAVRQIARAVEMLSAAVQTERDVRAGLAEVGAAHALPDAGFEFGTLGDFHSLVSTWTPDRPLVGRGEGRTPGGLPMHLIVDNADGSDLLPRFDAFIARVDRSIERVDRMLVDATGGRRADLLYLKAQMTDNWMTATATAAALAMMEERCRG